LITVHLPVPFWPAASSILSTQRLAVGVVVARMSRVISIR
jgi:hypothetical protein